MIEAIGYMMIGAFFAIFVRLLIAFTTYLEAKAKEKLGEQDEKISGK